MAEGIIICQVVGELFQSPQPLFRLEAGFEVFHELFKNSGWVGLPNRQGQPEEFPGDFIENPRPPRRPPVRLCRPLCGSGAADSLLPHPVCERTMT